MEINRLSRSSSELKSLLKAKEKYYHQAIKNSVPFEKIKTIEESIKELKLLLSKRKRNQK